MPKLSENATIERINVVNPMDTNRVFIVIGPNCWGKNVSLKQAVANAKKERPRWLGAPKWGWIAYSCQSDVRVTEMGDFEYLPTEGVVPYREVGRFNV